MSLGGGIAVLLSLLAARPFAGTPLFVAAVTPVVVEDSAGRPMMAPFLGGFDVPRPQLVDIDGDGDLDLFVQERGDRLTFFERVDGRWIWRTDRYQDLPIGEWYRFADMDHDGVIDLLSEMSMGYARLWRNAGTRTAPRFVTLGDTLREVDGTPMLVDRQNILNAVDIDCNGAMDLFIGRVQGTVDRFEEHGIGPDGTPRFALHTANWEGIEILGGEAAIGRPPSADSASGPFAPEETVRHGANTIAFADIDGDADLDLFWGDFFEPGLLLIRNVGSCAHPDFSSRPVQFPVGQPVLTSGYNAPAFGDVDGDGLLDMVLGVIGGAYQANATTAENLYFLRQGPLGSWHTETRQLITQVDVGSESAPALADLDGDGDLDLLIGNRIDPRDDRSSTISWFENIGSRTAPRFRSRGALPVRGEFNYAPTVTDLDGDGLPDLVTGTWRDRVAWYRNDGSRGQPHWTLADSALVTITRGSNTTPSFGDLDGDGIADLVVGEASGSLNLYRGTGTPGQPRFELVSDQFQDIRPGRRSAPTIVDLDEDGALDLLIGGDTGALEFWRNTRGTTRAFRFVRDTVFTLAALPGAAPVTGDLRGTGRNDVLLVGGNAGGLQWFERKR